MKPTKFINNIIIYYTWFEYVFVNSQTSSLYNTIVDNLWKCPVPSNFLFGVTAKLLNHIHVNPVNGLF